MKRNKRVVLAAICMMFFSGYNTFSAIPKGTVIIKNKAFDLNYAYVNKKEILGLEEFHKAIKDNREDIIVKDFQGKFILNSTGEKIAPHKIPRVLYKGEFTTEYLEGDGEEVVFNIESTNVINSTSIEIIFNRDIEDNIDNSNIKINGKKLNGKDKVVCEENKLCISLGTPLKNGEKIEVAIENICDIYGNKIQKTIEKECVISKENPKPEENYDDSKELIDLDDEISGTHGGNSKGDKEIIIEKETKPEEEVKPEEETKPEEEIKPEEETNQEEEIKQEENIDIAITAQDIEGTTKCDVIIDVHIKSIDSMDNQISVLIMSEDGEVMHLNQLEVIEGLATLKCRIDKKNTTIIINTVKASTKSIFEYDFS